MLLWRYGRAVLACACDERYDGNGVVCTPRTLTLELTGTSFQPEAVPAAADISNGGSEPGQLPAYTEGTQIPFQLSITDSSID